MKWFSGRLTNFGGCTVLVTRSGYTGEDGFEICILCGRTENYVKIFERFTNSGVKPCGLACRDILRLEAGYPLYGQDMDEKTTPQEARLDWAVRLDNQSFIGRDRYLELDKVEPSRILVGLEMEEQGIPRHGYKILGQNDDPLGNITSGGYSYTLGKGIALGYVQRKHTDEGLDVAIDMRGKRRRAKIRLGPFVQPRIPKL
jgi:aminomethyltransferase